MQTPKRSYFVLQTRAPRPSRKVNFQNILSRHFRGRVQHLHAPSHQMQRICSMSCPNVHHTHDSHCDATGTEKSRCCCCLDRCRCPVCATAKATICENLSAHADRRHLIVRQVSLERQDAVLSALGTCSAPTSQVHAGGSDTPISVWPMLLSIRCGLHAALANLLYASALQNPHPQCRRQHSDSRHATKPASLSQPALYYTSASILQ